MGYIERHILGASLRSAADVPIVRLALRSSSYIPDCTLLCSPYLSKGPEGLCG